VVAASLVGRLVATGVVVVLVVGISALSAAVAGRRASDPISRYRLRRTVRYGVAIVGLIALGFVWRVFGTRGGVIFGLIAAGFAFAMQEVVGAIAGWFNILAGGIFRVGDIIEMGGVRGEVIDLTPLRTKVLEMGASPAESSDPAKATSWVRGRQYTGRIVALSNKLSFTDPVFNFSGVFEYIWDEITLPIPYRNDWKVAEQILREEVERVSSTAGAREALEAMTKRYPVPRVELEPRVFARMTDNWMELSARFVVGVQESRRVQDEMSRRIRDRLDDAGIPISSETIDVTVHEGGE
jgi:small-conductance mechanosensitive channel